MAKAQTKKKDAALNKPPLAKPHRVVFKYVFDESYNPIYANGAYGGPTPQGEVTINFYVERNPIPLEETHALGPDGRVGSNIERLPAIPDGAVTMIRYITTGVIMSRETAKRIHDFLGRHLQNMEVVEQAKKVVEKSAGKKTKA